MPSALIRSAYQRVFEQPQRRFAMICDPTMSDMPITFASHSFFAFTGYRPEQVYGQNCRFLQGPESDPAAIEKMREAVTSFSDCQVDIVNYKCCGTPFLNRVTLEPVILDTGAKRFYAVQEPMAQRAAA